MPTAVCLACLSSYVQPASQALLTRRRERTVSQSVSICVFPYSAAKAIFFLRPCDCNAVSVSSASPGPRPADDVRSFSRNYGLLLAGT